MTLPRCKHLLGSSSSVDSCFSWEKIIIIIIICALWKGTQISGEWLAIFTEVCPSDYQMSLFTLLKHRTYSLLFSHPLHKKKEKKKRKEKEKKKRSRRKKGRNSKKRTNRERGKRRRRKPQILYKSSTHLTD